MVKKIVTFIVALLLVGAVYWTSQLNDLNLDQKIKVTLRHNDLWGGTGAVYLVDIKSRNTD